MCHLRMGYHLYGDVMVSDGMRKREGTIDLDQI